MKKIKAKFNSWHYLLSMVIIYLLFLIFDYQNFINISQKFYSIFIEIIPILAIMLILMTLTNKFVSPKIIQKHLGDTKIRKWFFVVIGGILSSGPIYMWYPLLQELKQKGLNDGLIATFLYNRAIKIPLIPMLLLYFNTKYAVVLTVVMIAASVTQGWFINKIIHTKQA